MVYHKHKDLYFDTQHEIDMTIEVIGTDLTITPDMIEFEAFEMNESLCSESELKFGRCEANSVKITVRGMPRSIKDEKIRIYEVIDGDVDNPFQYGIYKVYSDVPTADRTKRQITAYDAMYDILNADMKSWYASLSFPMTLKAFRDSFFTYLGIEQVETTLVNDGMVVNKTLVATQTDSESTITEESAISGKLIIEAICEINGCFGNINRDGKFDYVILESIISPLYPANNLYPANDLFPRDTNTESMSGHYITFDYEDFTSKAITKLEIRTAEYSAGITAGENGNNYAITGNFLVSDKLKDELNVIAKNTLSIIKNVAYTPIKSSTCVGNPCLELGDPIRFNTSREIIVSYILQRTLKGIQCKRDSIVSKGTETHSAKINSIKETLSNLAGRTNKLERTADRTLSELSDLDKNTTSRFEQTAEQIRTEITKRQDADSEMSSRLEQTAEQIRTEVSNSLEDVNSNITQTANSIELDVKNKKGSATITVSIKDNVTGETTTKQATVNIDADTINLTANDIINLLANNTINLTSNKIKINSTNFSVDENGKLRAVDGEFSGDGSFRSFHVQKDFSQGDKYNYTNLVKSEQDALAFGLLDESNILNGIIVYLNGDRGGETFVELNGTHILANGSPILTEDNNDAVTSNDTIKSLIYQEDKYHNDVGSYLHVNTSVGAFGIDWWASDTKLKENINPTEVTALDKLNQIDIIQFDWNGKLGRKKSHVDLGLSANQLETIIPEAVFNVEQPEDSEFDYIKQINENTLVSYCIKSIQELSAEVEQLKKEIKHLKGED